MFNSRIVRYSFEPKSIVAKFFLFLNCNNSAYITLAGKLIHSKLLSREVLTNGLYCSYTCFFLFLVVMLDAA